MKKILLLFIFLMGLLVLFDLFLSHKKTVTISNHPFTVVVAKTAREQEVGLAKYQSLSQEQGMYFPFNHPDYYTFWMKNMHFPIDILFLKQDKIIDIFSDVPVPQTGKDLPIYKPSSPADAALEIHAGLSKQYGFKIGDTVIITY